MPSPLRRLRRRAPHSLLGAVLVGLPSIAWLPAPLREEELLGLRLWQWIALPLALLALVALARLLTRFVLKALRAASRESGLRFDDALLEVTAPPLRWLLFALLLGPVRQALALAGPADRLLAGLGVVLAIGATTWLLLRSADVLSRAAESRLRAEGRLAAVAAVPLGRRALKGALVLLCALAAAQNLGLNVTGLLAGLGVGGLAVALAAQKSIENFFGGLMLVTDQPVRVGDFCRFGDRVGTIEDIGLRSTRVRTLDRTVVSIPNSQFATLQLENFARRDRIWLSLTLGLRYETTPDQLRHVLVSIKRLLLSHPKVDPDPARVRFVGFGAYSLDLELFAYVATADWDEFLAVREDLLLRLMDLVAESGTGFAFPSQTIYGAGDPGLDAARCAEAEARVREWRGRGELWLPEAPPAERAALRGSLAYPPEGAAVRG
jgi:MscS family membrane protein